MAEVGLVTALSYAPTFAECMVDGFETWRRDGTGWVDLATDERVSSVELADRIEAARIRASELEEDNRG